MPKRGPRALRTPSPPRLARASIIQKLRLHTMYEPQRKIEIPLDSRPPPLYFVRHPAAPPPESAGPAEEAS